MRVPSTSSDSTRALLSAPPAGNGVSGGPHQSVGVSACRKKDKVGERAREKERERARDRWVGVYQKGDAGALDLEVLDPRLALGTPRRERSLRRLQR
jgi:hypothetical protein